MESGGFEVDPRNEELKKLPAVLLKATGAAHIGGPLDHPGLQTMLAHAIQHVHPGDPGSDDDDIELSC